MNTASTYNRIAYIAGICNNRYINSMSKDLYRSLLFDFYQRGHSIDDLETCAKLAKSWSDFTDKLELCFKLA